MCVFESGRGMYNNKVNRRKACKIKASWRPCFLPQLIYRGIRHFKFMLRWSFKALCYAGSIHVGYVQDLSCFKTSEEDTGVYVGLSYFTACR